MRGFLSPTTPSGSAFTFGPRLSLAVASLAPVFTPRGRSCHAGLINRGGDREYARELLEQCHEGIGLVVVNTPTEA